MKQLGFIITLIAVVGAVMSSCNGKFGLGSRKDNDSLFLDIYFGMEQKAFYDYCWEMNRQKVLTHGPTNQNVEYHLTGTKHPITMHFYPSFHEGKIYEMPVTFNYDAWAPWNRAYQSDSLMTEVFALYKEWYGDDFKELNHPTMGKVYYKFDGHRRINLFIRDDQFVQAVFTDMRIAEKLKKEGEQQIQVESQ